MPSIRRIRGTFEGRPQRVQDTAGGIVLFIDEIHMVLGRVNHQESGGMDAANLLKPLLARGELRCIGATTLGRVQKVRRKGCRI